MATCGIKKYDELPARVGLLDVDYCRYLLSMHLKEPKNILDKMYLIGTDNKNKKDLLIALEGARRILDLHNLSEKELLEL